MGSERPLICASQLPCPCGWHSESTQRVRPCSCSDRARDRHAEHIERITNIIDFPIETTMRAIQLANLTDGPPGTSSETIRAGLMGLLP